MWERPRRSGPRRLVTVSGPLSRKPWPSGKLSPLLSPARWPRRGASFCPCRPRQRQLPGSHRPHHPRLCPRGPLWSFLAPSPSSSSPAGSSLCMNHPPAAHMPLAFLPLRLLLPFPEPRTPSPPPAPAVGHIQCLFGTYRVWGALPTFRLWGYSHIYSQALPSASFFFSDGQEEMYMTSPT